MANIAEIRDLAAAEPENRAPGALNNGPAAQEPVPLVEEEGGGEEEEERGEGEGEEEYPGQGALREAFLQKLLPIPFTLRALNLADLPEDTDACHICLTQYASPDCTETPVRLPCNHIVGSHCILSWFLATAAPRTDGSSVPTCPICRRVYPAFTLRFADGEGNLRLLSANNRQLETALLTACAMALFFFAVAVILLMLLLGSPLAWSLLGYLTFILVTTIYRWY